MDNLWEVLKNYYKSTWGIPNDVIEFTACETILSRFISGQSNYRISLGIKDSIVYVKDVISMFFGIDGWEFDIDFNPIAIYNRSNKKYLNFYQEVISISFLANKYDLKFIFDLCEKYTKLKERRDSFYERIYRNT